MYFLSLYLFLTSLICSSPLYAKSLKSMAKTAQTELQSIGAILVGVSIVWAGIVFMRGSGEGKQKITDVVFGAFCIFGVTAIISLIRRVTG